MISFMQEKQSAAAVHQGAADLLHRRNHDNVETLLRSVMRIHLS